MKYSMESLDFALDYVMPEIAAAKNKGVQFSRPELVKMAAYRHFLESGDTQEFNFKTSYSKSLCWYVIREAAIDLDTDGFFNFGDKDIKVEVY